MDFLLEIPYQDYQGSSLNKEDVLNQIKEIVNNGSLGNFTVDKSFTVCERNETTGDCKVRPKSHKVCVYSALKIDQPFTEELNNESSAEFRQLEQEFCTEVRIFYVL